MNGKTTTLIFLLVSSATLAGCTGEDNLDTITELEQDALVQNERIEALNLTVLSMQGMMLELNETILSLNGQNTALDEQILTYLSDIEDLNYQINQYLDQISELDELNLSKTEIINQLNENITSFNELITQLDSQILILDTQIDAAYDEGRAQGIIDAAPVSTLDTIIDRGTMKCGVKDSQYGMGYFDPDTGYSGLDISYCQAVAAAIGLDPMTDIEYILAAGYNRFELLADGTIDVLIRTTTWTTTRDAQLDADFGAINFYDGQSILVNKDVFPNADSALDLDGASICVAIGSTSAGNIADYFATNGMSYQEVEAWNDGPAFADEQCDALTGDLSSLVSMKWMYEQDDSVEFEMAIMPEVISKEPLASVTRDYDTEWNEIISWVWYGMVTAEELGITSTNYMNADTSNPSVDRLLNQNLGLGTQSNPLPANWMQSVLSAVGNYGEIYDNAFCDGTYDGYSGSNSMTNCLMSRSGTLNALVSEGGLQYAPPMR